MKAKLAAFFSVILAVVYFLFRLERGKRQDAEAKLENAESEKKDAVLKEQASQLDESNAQLKDKLASLEEIEKKLESGQDLTPEEAQRYWNGK